jgi:hypothetical protein
MRARGQLDSRQGQSTMNSNNQDRPGAARPPLRSGAEPNHQPPSVAQERLLRALAQAGPRGLTRKQAQKALGSRHLAEVLGPVYAEDVARVEARTSKPTLLSLGWVVASAEDQDGDEVLVYQLTPTGRAALAPAEGTSPTTPRGRRTRCPVTRERFRAIAQGLPIQVGKAKVLAEPKEFHTGSFGWYSGDQVILYFDGQRTKCQLSVSVTIIGSKRTGP